MTHKLLGSSYDHATDKMQDVTKFQDGNMLKYLTAKFKVWWLFHQQFLVFDVLYGKKLR